MQQHLSKFLLIILPLDSKKCFAHGRNYSLDIILIKRASFYVSKRTYALGHLKKMCIVSNNSPEEQIGEIRFKYFITRVFIYIFIEM